MAFEITPLTIDEMVKQARSSEKLYVTNNSGWRIDGETRKPIKQTLAMVHVTYNNANNDLTSIAIPASWIPVNLAEFASLDLLIQSENFRNLIRKNILVPVRAEDAERIRASPEGREELAKHSAHMGVVGSNGRLQEALTSFTIGPAGAVDTSMDAVATSEANSEALAALLDDFNGGRVTDTVATERFNRLPLSIEDITGNMSQMAATDSKLFEAMMARIETLEAGEPAKTFQSA